MVKEVVVTGKLEVADVLSFMFYHNYSKIGGALTGIFGIVGIILGPVMLWMGAITSGVILTLVGFMYAVATPLGFYTRAKRQLRTNPVFKNIMTFRFGSDDLKVELFTGNSAMLWQEVFRIKVLKKQILVYVKEAQALIIPIVNFDSSDDLQLVKDFVARNHLEVPHNRRLEVKIHDEEI